METSSRWELLVVRISCANEHSLVGDIPAAEVRCTSNIHSFHLPPESIAAVDENPADVNDDGRLSATLPGGPP